MVVSLGDVPAGVGLLVVKRGPNAGARFLLEPRTTRIGRHPDSDIFLDDVTVRGATPSSSRDGGRHGQRRRARSTAPTSIGSGSRRPTCTAATSCRSASSGWCSCTTMKEARSGHAEGRRSSAAVPLDRRRSSLLREEFPDVTISKIRFLESQGLVDPERTPSGYRKFYDHDVERLRWILRQQRENFLPLKVIKGRLDQDDDSEFELEEDQSLAPVTAGGTSARVGHGVTSARQTLPGFEPSRPTAASSAPAASAPGVPAVRGRTRPNKAKAPAAKSAAPARSRPPTPEAKAAAIVDPGEVTLEELIEASGCSPATAAGLASYGLICHRTVAGTQYYDEQSLAVAKLAAAFDEFGVGAAPPAPAPALGPARGRVHRTGGPTAVQAAQSGVPPEGARHR